MLARFLIWTLAFLAVPVVAQLRDYALEYQVAFRPQTGVAEVSLRIPRNRWVRLIDFNVANGQFLSPEANGEFEIDGERWQWRPPKKDAHLRYQVKVNTPRENDEHDAYMNENWVLMRADDLVPPARVRQKKGAQAEASVDFKLPAHWSSVNTEWLRDTGNRFVIENPDRGFVRPEGWLIAGQLTTRHEDMQGTQMTISAPQGHNSRPMETLVFLEFTWEELAEVFGKAPPKILIVNAAEPMWRGGLSAPQSLYIHSGRPLVSENGTSTLLHELVHVLSGIHGAKYADWIVEGIAEYYAIEVLHRAGGLSDSRKADILAGLKHWSRNVKTLSKRSSSGETTGKAVIVFVDLDKELRKASAGRYHLDHLVRRLDRDKDVDLKQLQAIFRDLTGKESRVLQRDYLQPPSA